MFLRNSLPGKITAKHLYLKCHHGSLSTAGPVQTSGAAPANATRLIPFPHPQTSTNLSFPPTKEQILENRTHECARMNEKLGPLKAFLDGYKKKCG